MIVHEKTKVFEWDAMEIEHREKSVDWYWALGIAVIAGTVLSIIFANYLLAVILVMGGIMMALHGNEKPHPVHVEISERGVRLNEGLYLFKSMKSFWIFRDQRGRDRLLLVTGRQILPIHILTFGTEIDPITVRIFLLKHLAEVETKQSVIEVIAESLGL